MADSLASAYPIEQARIRQLITDYRSLPNGAGMLGALMLEQTLAEADRAMAAQDVVAMIQAYAAMRECQ